MRPPGSDQLRRQYEERLRTAGDEEDAVQDDRRERGRLALSIEFEESTRGKVMLSQAKALAQASVRSVQLDVQRRREQLRALLVAEGLQTEGELSEQAARAMVDRLQEARNQAARLKERAEQERLKVVEAAREKQDRGRIEPLRLAERAALTLACKEVNLGQMRDKRELEESRREEERLQHSLQLKTLQAKMEREELEARGELARKKALCDALQQQVEEQQRRHDRLKEEETAEGVRRLNQLREELHQERLAELAKRRRQREELQRLFAEQIKQRERALAEQADRDAEADEAAARTARRLIKEEREDRSKADAAMEMKMFMAHSAALKKQQELADMEEQRIRDEQAAAKQREQDERRCRVQAARQRMLQDTLEERQKQVEASRLARTREAQEAADEARRLEHCRQQNLQLASDLQRRRADQRRQYASDLQQQIKYQQLLKERQAKEEELQLQQSMKDEEQYQERVKQLLQNPQKYATHPFRLKIEGRALAWPE